MKKILAFLLVVALFATMAVPTFAASLKSPEGKANLIYYDDFSDPTARTYGGQDNYVASVADGKLDLKGTTAAADIYAWTLPGAQALTTETKITYALSFKILDLGDGQGIFPAFAVSDSSNFFIAGSNTGYGSHAQVFYSQVENHALKANTYDYAYFMKDEGKIRKFNFNAAKEYELIVELEEGKEPVISVYEDGELVPYYPKEDTNLQGRFKVAFTDLAGGLGLCLRNGTHLSIDSLAVFDTTGLAYEDIFEKTEAGPIVEEPDVDPNLNANSTPVYFEDFNDPSKYDFSNENFDVAVKDGKLTLYSLKGAAINAYTLPGSPTLSDAEYLTIAYSFSPSIISAYSQMSPAFGITDDQNFCIAGFNSGNTTNPAAGVQYYFGRYYNGAITMGTADVNGDGVNDTTRDYAYLYTNEGLTTPFRFVEDDNYVLIVEMGKKTSPVVTLYNGEGQKINLYFDDSLNGGSAFSSYKNYDGKLGLLVNNSNEMNYDAVVVYQTKGLDHSTILAALNNQSNPAGGDDTNTDDSNTTTEPTAPVTTAPSQTDTTAPDSTEDTTTKATESEKKKGCGSTIGCASILLAVVPAVILIRRKKEN